MLGQSYYSSGKLLISAEYLVLDGAKALAVPTKMGQKLTVHAIHQQTNHIQYKAILHDATEWFSCSINTKSWQVTQSNHPALSSTLLQILLVMNQFNPSLFHQSYQIESMLEFPTNWGLGSSSTLVNNLAMWANINPYNLLNQTFGGSGYDIACANAKSAILYQKQAEERLVTDVDFNPPFKHNLWLVHLNQKQNSREGIAHYSNQQKRPESIKKASDLSIKMLNASSLNDFMHYMNQHEQLIASSLQLTPAKELLFNDFTHGAIKSLGAWGGDFVLVASKENPTSYFKNKGYHTIFGYQDLVI